MNSPHLISYSSKLSSKYHILQEQKKNSCNFNFGFLTLTSPPARTRKLSTIEQPLFDRLKRDSMATQSELPKIRIAVKPPLALTLKSHVSIV
jgi:hypothetical protein